MWDMTAPLKLLESMPAKLTAENLKTVQAVIDVDKYKNSAERNADLCGEYAPFCALCDKQGSYPCAVAFVKMKQSEGMEIEIADQSPEPEVAEEAAEEAVYEEPIAEEEPAPEEQKPVRRIRIAIARRRRV